MKYIIVAIFLVLLGLVAYRQFRGTTDQSVVIDPDEASLPSEVEEMDGELPSTPSPTEPGRVDSGDPLRDSVHEIVISLLVEDPDPAAIDANYQRLAAVFADAVTPVGATVEFAIRDTLTMMELEVAKARPRNGVRLPLDANQTAFVASQALRYTQDIRRRALPKSGNQDHEGSMLASKPIEEMDIRGGYVGLSWKKIGDFTYKEGMELPDRVVALRDKKIAMTGYMMAMGQHEHIREFLLVESQWTCCFGVPPEINQVVVVMLPDDHIGLDLVTRPVLVYGSFEAGEEREDGWLISVYRIRADDVEEAP